MPTKPTERLRRSRASYPPCLRFSPTAWAKLLYLRDLGPTEVGGFGISAADDPLWIEDFQLVAQACTAASVVFDDAAVADFFDTRVDEGLQPAQFARVWIHTHPGGSAEPSATDEETLERVFGRADWALMFILARRGQSYARLQFNVGPGGAIQVPVEVDFFEPFAGSDHDAWKQEYLAAVTDATAPRRSREQAPGLAPGQGPAADHPWFDELLAERLAMEELAIGESVDLWPTQASFEERLR